MTSSNARLKRILAAMLAFGGGNFSIRLPSDWEGLEGEIAAACEGDGRVKSRRRYRSRFRPDGAALAGGVPRIQGVGKFARHSEMERIQMAVSR
jgi:hypothetical protein